MSAETWHIGVCANLDPGGSVHRSAFERGVHMAMQTCKPTRPLRLHTLSDGADPQRAYRAAQHLVSSGVKVVVGHFSSAAAAAAAPLYAQAGVVLLLPAATAVALTQNTSTYRICGHDQALADFSASNIAQQHRVKRLHIQHDGSAHAFKMSAYLTQALKLRHVLCADALEQADAFLFVGHFCAATQALRHLGRALPSKIFLSDDGVHPDLVKHIPTHVEAIFIHGLQPLGHTALEQDIAQAHQTLYGEPAGIYFAETFCALQIAIDMAHQHEPLSHFEQITWHTLWGPLRFRQRESRCERFALWRAHRSLGLQVVDHEALT